MTTITHTQDMTAAAEVWRVNDGGTALTLTHGVYGSAEALRLASTGLSLDIGQGLAGGVLARKVPVLLDALDADSFERCDAAAAAGVVAAVAIPIFDQASLTSVLVMMFRGDTSMKGAVELWAGRRGRFELGRTAAHYAGLGRFGKISRYVNFPIGSGLPGEVWQSASPQIMSNLGGSRGFLRSAGAESAGLDTGFGFPVIHRNELMAVMLWLSSPQSPLTTVQEVWVSPDGTAAALRRAGVQAQGLPGFADADAPDAHSVPAVIDAARTRRPVVFENPHALGTARVTARHREELSAGVAIPVFSHDHIRAVALLAW